MKDSKVENLLIDLCVQFYVVLVPTNAVYTQMLVKESPWSWVQQATDSQGLGFLLPLA